MQNVHEGVPERVGFQACVRMSVCGTYLVSGLWEIICSICVWASQVSNVAFGTKRGAAVNSCRIGVLGKWNRWRLLC